MTIDEKYINQYDNYNNGDNPNQRREGLLQMHIYILIY